MSEKDKEFTGNIPGLYDTYMVPLIFEPYARDIARRVASDSPLRVLETAAGSGVVARALAPLLRANAKYVVTDLNQPMIDHAKAQQGADERIQWQVADALNLPFENDSFDAVVCQFGVMFFPDRIAGFKEALRVLKSGRTFTFNVWGNIRDNEFAEVVANSVAEIFPDNPPLFLARTPHGYHDVDLVRSDLTSAGFSKISFHLVEERSTGPTAQHVAIAYCEGTPLRNEIEATDASLLERVTVCATEALERRFGKGEISGKLQAQVVVASE